jgi:kynurenine formamidase
MQTRSQQIPRMLASAAMSCLLLNQAAAAEPFDAYEIIDLTHVLDEDFPYIPVPGVTFPFSKVPIATLDKNGVAANAWRIHEHIGTQIDAPNHFAAGAVGLEALQARDLIVPVVVIDFREQGRADRDAALTIDHVRAWERTHGRIPQRAAVALYTGWDRKVGSAEFIGLDEEGHKHFPGFSPEALKFLIEERNIWGVGVDTLSFDPGRDDTYAAHRTLLKAGKWALEALANLDRLPPTGATLFIGAPRVAGATGSTARVIGLVPRR